MKAIDKKGKVFGKVSIIDLVFLLLVLTLALLGFRYMTAQETAEKVRTLPLRYTVEATEAPMTLVEAVTPGAEVFNSIHQHRLGQVVDLEVRPYKVQVTDAEAEVFRWAEVPDFYDVRIVIDAQVTVDDYNYWMGRDSIKVGQELFIKGKGFAAKTYIVDLEEVGE